MRVLPILLVLAGTASAQVPTHPEGQYGGVEPGQSQKPEPGKKAKKPPPKGTLSWIGFEVKGGGSDLFFQSVAQFQVTQHVEKDTLVIDLDLNKLGQNTWRQLDTRFFDTPIAKIVARKMTKKKSGIEVRVTFKNPKDAKEASMRTATEGDGFYYAHLTFSGGGAAPAATGGAAPGDVEK